MPESSTVSLWMLDSSAFIHALIVGRVPLLISLRSPAYFPEYVFRVELGSNAKEETREEAAGSVRRNQIGVKQLTLGDLDRIAALEAPRKIGLGELACAVIAERLAGGVLCDDWRARRWIAIRMPSVTWDSIEGLLLDAAQQDQIGELDLVDFQEELERNCYHCRVDLRMEYLRCRMAERKGGT